MVTNVPFNRATNAPFGNLISIVLKADHRPAHLMIEEKSFFSTFEHFFTLNIFLRLADGHTPARIFVDFQNPPQRKHYTENDFWGEIVFLYVGTLLCERFLLADGSTPARILVNFHQKKMCRQQLFSNQQVAPTAIFEKAASTQLFSSKKVRRQRLFPREPAPTNVFFPKISARTWTWWKF